MRKTFLYIWLIGMLSYTLIPNTTHTNADEVAIVSSAIESVSPVEEEIDEELVTEETIEEPIIEDSIEDSIEDIETEVLDNVVLEEVEMTATEEEIELLALLTVAESEGQPEHGQRLVIDTVLNRVDHEDPIWPDTITEVVYQPNQFSAMWTDRVDRSVVTDEVRELVKEELISRSNHDTLYFRAHNYSIYGEPMFSIGDHYFSSY